MPLWVLDSYLNFINISEKAEVCSTSYVEGRTDL